LEFTLTIERTAIRARRNAPLQARRKVGGAFRAGGSISSAIKQSNSGHKENAGIVGH